MSRKLPGKGKPNATWDKVSSPSLGECKQRQGTHGVQNFGCRIEVGLDDLWVFSQLEILDGSLFTLRP